MSITQPTIAQRVIYPETDGKPMAETDVHRQELMATIETLENYFAAAPEKYVAGNMLLYYEEGTPAASVAPDVFVVRGVTKDKRCTYKLWEEPYGPQFVVELTSRSTRLEDLGTKRVVYANIGVEEYLLFDPLGEYLRPPFQAFRLNDGELERVELDPDGSFLSQTLGLRLRVEEQQLRLYNEETGERLLRSSEARARGILAEQQARQAEQQARQAEQRAQSEAAARQAAEAELVQLRAELARLRGEGI
ncbi:MAG: Uma2 family endonuclease [Chloroflexales bacterium]|nr:Uma2 family endonuclease [Chloroflexales bacterium]